MFKPELEDAYASLLGVYKALTSAIDAGKVESVAVNPTLDNISSALEALEIQLGWN